MRKTLLVLALLAACTDAFDDTSTTTDPIVGGTTVTGPTRAVFIDMKPDGCSGVLLTEAKVLTAYHCAANFALFTPTIVHPLPGGGVEKASVLSWWNPPTLASCGLECWLHDLAVVELDHKLTLPTGADETFIDDGTGAVVGDTLKCVGAGETIDGDPTTIGTLHSIELPVSNLTADTIELKGSAAHSILPGDSGGPCWSKSTGRIIGVIRSLRRISAGDYRTYLSPTAPDAGWIASKAFAAVMFGPPQTGTPFVRPDYWRIATLGTGRAIVGMLSGGLEIYTPSTYSWKASFVLGPPASVPLAPGFAFSTPSTQFVDVTGDGISDLVTPTSSEIDVLVGPVFASTPTKTTPLGSSTWAEGNVDFGDIDGTGGKDYIWRDGTGAWVALANGDGTFGSVTKRASWTESGAVTALQFDATAGDDIGWIGSTTIDTFSALGSGGISSVAQNSPITAPGKDWFNFAGFDVVDKNATNDWVAIRGTALPTQTANGLGKFTTFHSTPIEIGASWEVASTMADINFDGSTDWIGLDDTYVYVKPGLGDGRFGRMKVQEHHLPSVPSWDKIALADLDGDGMRDLVLFDTPAAGSVTVLPFIAGSAPGVFIPLSSDATWDWADLVATMKPITSWRTTALDELFSAFAASLHAGTAGTRKITGGSVLATLQLTPQGTQVTTLADGLPRTGRWRWTQSYALRATADVDGDGSDELVFTDARGMVAAGSRGDGLSLVVARAFGTMFGSVPFGADARLAGAGDIDHDGRDELLVQGAAGAALVSFTGSDLEPRWNVDGNTTSRSDSASLQSQQQHGYPALAVVPGTHVRAVITGNGDADLYLRFGAAPTLSAFDCRPYTSTANETCDLVVPQGVTTAYVMVAGYTAASYTLTVTYAPDEGIVAPAGDVDRDGYADLVVETPNAWTVYRGSPQGPLQAFSVAAALGDRLVGADAGLLVARPDGLWRLSPQGASRIMPWPSWLDPTSRILVLGDITGDGATDFAAITSTGWLVELTGGPNGATVFAATPLPFGATLLGAGELDANAGPELAVATAGQLLVYGGGGSQLTIRASGTLGATSDQSATASVESLMPRTGAQRSLVVQLTPFTAPQ